MSRSEFHRLEQLPLEQLPLELVRLEQLPVELVLARRPERRLAPRLLLPAVPGSHLLRHHRGLAPKHLRDRACRLRCGVPGLQDWVDRSGASGHSDRDDPPTAPRMMSKQRERFPDPLPAATISFLPPVEKTPNVLKNPGKIKTPAEVGNPGFRATMPELCPDDSHVELLNQDRQHAFDFHSLF
jgi:hypothetical protein